MKISDYREANFTYFRDQLCAIAAGTRGEWLSLEYHARMTGLPEATLRQMAHDVGLIVEERRYGLVAARKLCA